eukprot:NODE_10977_length_423_cov_2.304813_g9856_i0.p3 GENE.NODE_10977_length_423_cov_2.304813_g9856_i0~~NODE_10977_length_423_cov_2.304813_g9856_i0.p3  ORF type:complete len:79 (+),score=3.66 NODE_10977_length_423_cov_2.304813_g9856_i0:144-380(+)
MGRRSGLWPDLLSILHACKVSGLTEGQEPSQGLQTLAGTNWLKASQAAEGRQPGPKARVRADLRSRSLTEGRKRGRRP